MKTVYKYELDRVDRQEVQLPAEAAILCVERQRSNLCMWAEVTPTAPTETRTILLRGTGHPFTGGEDSYIGTVFDGGLVWHVYEEIT